MDDYMRSSELVSTENSVLVVVDVQERLLPAMAESAALEQRLVRLLKGAAVLTVPIVISEQYPHGLGSTVGSLLEAVSDRKVPRVEKKCFSCVGVPEFRSIVDGFSRQNVVVCGIESHVCVLQTVSDLLAEGFRVSVPVDAVGSRHEANKAIALRRMESWGVSLTSLESILFEWCETAEHPQFRVIQDLIK